MKWIVANWKVLALVVLGALTLRLVWKRYSVGISTRATVTKSPTGRTRYDFSQIDEISEGKVRL